MAVDILEILRQRHSGKTAEPSLLDSLAKGADVEPLPPPKKGLIDKAKTEVGAWPLTLADITSEIAGDAIGGWVGLATGAGVDIANFLAPEFSSKHPFLAQGGMLAAEDAIMAVKDLMPKSTWPYSPTGELAEMAEKQKEWAAKPFEIIRESSDYWGKKVAEATGRPDLGAAVSVVIEGTTIFAGPKLAKSAIKPAFKVSRTNALRLKRKLNRVTRTGDYSDAGLVKAAQDILDEAKKNPAMMAEIERYSGGGGQPPGGGYKADISIEARDAIAAFERRYGRSPADYEIADIMKEVETGGTQASAMGLGDEPVKAPTPESVEVSVYHGTGMPLRGNVVEEKMSFSPSRETAEAYASDRGTIEGNAPRLYKADIKFENPKIIKTEDRVGFDWYDEAKSAGHDGVVITEGGEPIEYVVIDPSTVKKIAGRPPKVASAASGYPPDMAATMTALEPDTTAAGFRNEAAKNGVAYSSTNFSRGEVTHEFYDPITKEYFKADTPESVAQELEAHRVAFAQRTLKHKGVTLEDYARKVQSWYEGKGGDLQQIKQEVIDFLAEKTDFDTPGHKMDFIDRGEELLGIINKAAREKGLPVSQVEIEKPMVKPTESAKMSPRKYQEMFPEKTVHLDWDRANSPRFVFEGAGDILRELQKSSSDPGYISEKLNRIKRYFNELHPDDTIEAARKYAPGKLAKLTEEYKNQPVESAAELTAKKAIIALLEGKNILAKRLYSKIESNLGDIEAFKNIGKVERPPTIKAKLSDSNISNPKMIAKEDRIAYMKEANRKRSLLKREQIEDMYENAENPKGMLPDEALDVNESIMDRIVRTTESSEPRDLVDIFNDAKTVFEGEEGSIYIGKEPGQLRGLTHEQRMAMQRLVADAKKMVGDLTDYLREIGLDEKQIAFVRTQIDQMRKVEPETFGEVRQHWIDARAIAAGDKIVKQRKPGKGRQATPVYLSEAKMVQELPNLKRPINMKVGMTNPMRALEQLDPEGTGIREVYHDYRQAEQLYRRESKQIKQELKDLRRGVSWKSRKRIGAYAVGQQERGLNILHKMGIKVPELTAAELRIYENLRGRYEQLFERIQTMRQMIGMEPLEKVDNYFTFFRTFGILEKAGITFNPLLDKASIVSRTYNSYGSTPFKFGIERIKKGTMPVELDPFKVFENYSDVTLRHLHLSPWVAKMNELMGVLPDLKTGKYNWLLRQKAPNTYNFLRNWVDHIAGKPSELSFGSRWDRVFGRLNKNLAFAILGANARSFGIQALALVNTVGEIGWGYTAKGIGATLEDVLTISGKNRKFALKHSKVLDGRTYDITIEDAMRGIRGGQIGAVQDFLGRGFLKPMQLSDMETAIATWNGAYKLAEDNGMNLRRAVNFADDVVTRTQASALPGDLAPIQWSAFGKSITLFQTFVINNWGFLTKDVLGLGNVSISNDVALRKVVRLVSAMTAANILLEGWGEWGGLGMQSPFPTPIKDIQESIESGDPAIQTALKVAFGLLDPVPVIGSARYGKGPGGPVFELGYETVRSLQGAPMAKPLPEVAGKLLGVPGTTQVGKSIRAKERGETPYGIIIGRYSPEDYATRKRKNPLGGLKGLEGLSGL